MVSLKTRFLFKLPLYLPSKIQRDERESPYKLQNKNDRKSADTWKQVDADGWDGLF